jgi:formamidopyrimidine-DNA glycosylase
VTAPAELLDDRVGNSGVLVGGDRDPHRTQPTLEPMPELPEVEITARRLSRGAAGAEIESALAPGMVTMKTFDPPLDALAGRNVEGVRRAGKMLVVDAGELALLIHLMSAGRLQLWDTRSSLRDRTSRLLIRLEGGRELRLREFGTQQRAWGKLLPAEALASDEAVATLGPDAYPAPPAEEFAGLLDQPRHLHPLLRDQRVIAGIGRSWVDELLWTARLSPFQRASDLDDESGERLREACDEVLGGALEHYEEVIGDVIPDKLPMPLQVHRRAGDPCPRCGTTIEAIHFKDYVMCYCPEEQTAGRVLKDRRLSKLLK